MVAEIAEYQITLRLSATERALLDQARGNTDLATYVINTVLEAAQRRVARTVGPLPVSDVEPTPEEHIRMAARARENSVSIDEFEQMVLADLEQIKVKHHNRNS
jgi:ribosomal protein S10